MEERPLRDVERWKDKIEVRLDNRQVFFLFFGSALVACLLFVLGVIVGKRLESRGKAIAPEIEDPLALLDRVATAPRPAEEAPPPPPAPVAAAKPAAAKPAAAPAPKPEPPATVKAAAATPRPAEPAKPEPAKAEPPKPEAAKPAAAKPEAAPKAAGKGRFTLQIGSFPDRAEAEAFAQRFPSLAPNIVARDIPGKGIWFRVLVGDYGSKDEAVAAKMAFEKQHNVIAFVAGPR